MTTIHWIDVEQETPLDNDCVLAVTHDYFGGASCVVPARYEYGVWYDIDNTDRDGDEEPLFQVVRWSYMPEPG